MVTYKFNLSGLSDKDQEKLAKKALSTARGASAVDTGAFRRSWRVRRSGDFLFVTNSLRYAAPVEFGSSVHKVHKFKVRDALARIGLRTGTVSIGAGTSSTIGSSKPKSGKDKDTGQRRSIPTAAIAPLTIAEIRSPALLLNRLRALTVTQPTLPSRQPTISKSQLFNRSYLIAAIAAAIALREEEQELEEEQP